MCYDFVKGSAGDWVVLELSYTFVPDFVNSCKFKYDASNNFEKLANDCSVQELVIRTLIDAWIERDTPVLKNMIEEISQGEVAKNIDASKKFLDNWFAEGA